MARDLVSQAFYYHHSKWMAPSENTEEAPGMGLGLAKLYARYFGGDLRVVSMEVLKISMYVCTGC